MKNLFSVLFLFVTILTAQTQEATIDQDTFNLAVENYTLGVEALKSDEYLASAKYMELAVQFNPNNTDYWHVWSMALGSLKLLDSALSVIDQGIAIEPEQSDYLLQRANLLFKLKRYKEAAGVYTQVLRYQSTSEVPVNEGHVYYNRGNCWLHLKNYRNAADSYKQALTIGYELANVHHNYATALRRLGEETKACEEYRLAVDQGSAISQKYVDKYCR